MAADLVSLGPLRLPIKRRDGFVRQYDADVAEFFNPSGDPVDTQLASLDMDVTRAETASLVATQTGALNGEDIHSDTTSLGPLRLPMRRFVSFSHGVTSPVAETAAAGDTQSATGVFGVARSESGTASESQNFQTANFGAVAETSSPTDIIDGALTRVGALVSSPGPMGVSRPRWVDFIHPAVVEEIAAALDVSDGNPPGALSDVRFESSASLDTPSARATFNSTISDDLDLADTVGLESQVRFVDVAESASLTESQDGDRIADERLVAESATALDITTVTAIWSKSVSETANAIDTPGIRGELFVDVAEFLASLDKPGFITQPLVTLDGTRTICVIAENRTVEVEEELVDCGGT